MTREKAHKLLEDNYTDMCGENHHIEEFIDEIYNKIESDLDNLISIQKDNLTDDYMDGLCNGLICALACINGKDPEYIENKKR